MTYEFPNQNISENKKDNVKWHLDHYYAFIGYTGTAAYNERLNEIIELSYAIVGKPSPKTAMIIEKTLTKQYGDDLQVPFEIYPLIEQKLEDALGKYRLRPLRSKTSVINRTAVNSKLDAIIDGIAKVAENQAVSELNEEHSLDLEMNDVNQNTPEEFNQEKTEEFKANYRTESEKLGEDILDYLLNSKNEKEKIYTALQMYLGFGDVGLFIEEKNGNPTILVPHLLEFFSDKVPTEDINDDAEIFAVDQWFSQNEILNKFNLTEPEKKSLEAKFKNNDNGEIKIGQTYTFKNSDFVKGFNGISKCRVVTLYWKSRRKLEFNTYVNKKTKKKESRKVTENIKPKDKKRIIENDQLEVIDVENIRHITVIGDDLVLSWGSLKDQITSVGDPRKRFIPFVRITSDNSLRTGETRSMAKKLKFLQDLASELLWELRFNMRQMDGNALVYDMAMFPKEMFGDPNKNPRSAINKVQRLLKKDRLMIINSKDKRSNHYASSVNVSQKGRIQDLLSTFGLIEQLADKICGLPSQNANQVYQKATTAEIQAQNTTSRLEEYFGPFEAGIERVLNYTIAKAQQLYKSNDIISYYSGDKAQKFIKVTESFANDDLGVKFVNNRKDFESKNNIDQIATRMMGTTDDLNIMISMLDILDSENYESARELLERTKNHVEQMKAEAEAQMKAIEDAKIKDAQEARANENEQKELDRQNNIDVANIAHDKDALVTQLKEENSNLRKAADVEVKNKELDQKANESKEKSSSKAN